MFIRVDDFGILKTSEILMVVKESSNEDTYDIRIVMNHYGCCIHDEHVCSGDYRSDVFLPFDDEASRDAKFDELEKLLCGADEEPKQDQRQKIGQKRARSAAASACAQKVKKRAKLSLHA